VGAALERWATARFGGTVTLAEPAVAVSGGMDSWIHLVRFRGAVLPLEWRAPLVARVLPTAERHHQAQREALVQAWCAEQGYPTPRVLAVAAPGEALAVPLQVVERVPGTTMLAALTARPWHARSLVDRLARLHVELHGLDAASWTGAADAGSLLARRLRLVRDVAARGGRPDLARALERVDRLTPRLEGVAPSLCHGDLHPLNVLVDGAHASVIDWTDAGMGDRHGDVARTALLFRVAAVAAGSRAERAGLGAVAPLLARRYLRSYAARLPLDAARLRLWEPVHLLHGWAQLEAGDERSQRAAPGLRPWLRQRFEQRMAELG
jgi:aminoglycoside phosphotransferase (APT) family kinase protein